MKWFLSLCLLVPAVAAANDMDHSAWDALVKKHVHGELVDYAGFAKDKAALQGYVDALGKQDPEKLPSKDAKLAFWINSYNAHTVAAILAHWPGIKSVQDPYPDFGFFKQKDKLVGGKKYSLNDIENEVIRPTFKDPRIHAALNCASISCPPLLNEAFTAAKLDAQLNKVMDAFINDDKRNQIKAGDVKLSSIFDWYKVDFQPDVKTWLAKHLKGDKKAAIEKADKLQFLNYDWALNVKK